MEFEGEVARVETPYWEASEEVGTPPWRRAVEVGFREEAVDKIWDQDGPCQWNCQKKPE